MDKWDEIVHRIQQSILAQEPEAATSAGLQLFAEFGRTLDRIATALEREVEAIQEPVPEVLDL